METHKRKVVGFGYGMVGLILVVLGIKYLPLFLALVKTQPELQNASNQGSPMILFFNVDEPCECMLELANGAEQQMAAWTAEQGSRIPVLRLWMDERKDIEAKYQVFRAPCLVLLDAEGQVAWRQDYPLIEDGPFKLDELEAAIAALGVQ